MKQPNVIGICPVETSYMVKDRAYMIFNRTSTGAGYFIATPAHVGFTCTVEGSSHLNEAVWELMTPAAYWRKKLGITNV